MKGTDQKYDIGKYFVCMFGFKQKQLDQFLKDLRRKAYVIP